VRGVADGRSRGSAAGFVFDRLFDGLFDRVSSLKVYFVFSSFVMVGGWSWRRWSVLCRHTFFQ
jgi:hypothetical protein